ncbi:hypothetical protein MRS44_007013 [Fusarium solani]|uniref:uncharacterized protein n=1 Tax=Fusarium solani TaxID=169388 RepID=UPI0032C420E5|nr:hypothetical protein MRS44_007013 [Fusarium solani]
MLSPNLAIIKFDKKSIESQQLCRLLAKSRRSIRRIGQHWDHGLSVAFAGKCMEKRRQATNVAARAAEEQCQNASTLPETAHPGSQVHLQ